MSNYRGYGNLTAKANRTEGSQAKKDASSGVSTFPALPALLPSLISFFALFAFAVNIPVFLCSCGAW
jgi:hypothetical protein